MQSKQIKKSLICILTDKERREYGITLATVLGDMEAVEAQKKAEMDNYKNRLAGMQARVDELSGKVRNGKEWRDVDCRVLYGVPDKEHKQIVRLDTGETVSTEVMTEADLQLVMPLDTTAGIDNDENHGTAPEIVVWRADAEDDDDDADDNDGDDSEPEESQMQADAKACMNALLSEKKKENRILLIEKLIEDHGDAAAIHLNTLQVNEPRMTPAIRDLITEYAREANPTGDY